MTQNAFSSLPIQVVKKIRAKAETSPAHSKGDAADDPAIWVHPTNPSLSKILGTNKRSGLQIFDLKGNEVFKWNEHPLNNIDIRYGLMLDGKKVDVVVGSSKQFNGFIVLGIDGKKDGANILNLGKPVKTGPSAYGLCLYQEKSGSSGKLYAFVTHKTGSIEQWLIEEGEKGQVTSRKVRTLQVSGQVEGCVADDENGSLYVAEEAEGVWRFSAAANGEEKGKLIASIKDSAYLEPDLEGLTLYQGTSGAGYLLLSVQQRNEFAVFERGGNNKYLFSFSIGPNNGKDIDQVSHTDGIDVVAANLGPEFPHGVLVVQDDENSSNQNDEEIILNQNFKLVPWPEVANSIKTPLLIDNRWSPRSSLTPGDRVRPSLSGKRVAK